MLRAAGNVNREICPPARSRWSPSGPRCSRAPSRCRSRSTARARSPRRPACATAILDLRRPELQKNFLLRDRVTLEVRNYFHEQEFIDVETPILTQLDARGRARLPGALARAPRQLLRPAAVAAALQAAPDGGGLRALHPDRPLLPRRGPARRPPARVHADRRGDDLPHRGGRLRADRRALRPRLPARRHRAAGAVPAHDVRRGHGALRQRPAGPAVRPGDRGPLRAAGARAASAASRRRWRTAA